MDNVTIFKKIAVVKCIDEARMYIVTFIHKKLQRSKYKSIKKEREPVVIVNKIIDKDDIIAGQNDATVAIVSPAIGHQS
uniref:Uncharacterized protein n=1 Tax=Triticum urartu TaxID=4572 RepID=A0A8R7UDY0_TRIUA